MSSTTPSTGVQDHGGRRKKIKEYGIHMYPSCHRQTTDWIKDVHLEKTKKTPILNEGEKLRKQIGVRLRTLKG